MPRIARKGDFDTNSLSSGILIYWEIFTEGSFYKFYSVEEINYLHMIFRDMMFATGTWNRFSVTLLQLLRLEVSGIHVYSFCNKTEYFTIGLDFLKRCHSI